MHVYPKEVSVALGAARKLPQIPAICTTEATSLVSQSNRKGSILCGNNERLHQRQLNVLSVPDSSASAVPP